LNGEPLRILNGEFKREVLEKGVEKREIGFREGTNTFEALLLMNAPNEVFTKRAPSEFVKISTKEMTPDQETSKRETKKRERGKAKSQKVRGPVL
jgi:hypothetical protein